MAAIQVCACVWVCVWGLMHGQFLLPYIWLYFLTFVVYSGSVAYVQTPATVRAKELRDLYHSISAPLMSSSDVDNRLDVLLNLKVRLSYFIMQTRTWKMPFHSLLLSTPLYSFLFFALLSSPIFFSPYITILLSLCPFLFLLLFFSSPHFLTLVSSFLTIYLISYLFLSFSFFSFLSPITV